MPLSPTTLIPNRIIRLMPFPALWPRVRHTEEVIPPTFSREDILAAKFRVAKVLPFQRSAKPFIGNLSLSVFSGLLLVFSFPDWNFWSLGWVATAPLIMAVAREQRFWRSFVYGMISGTVFYAGSSYWVTYSMHHYGGLPLWLCYLLLVVLAGILAVFTGAFAGTLALAVKQFGGWALLAAPALWVASEFARIEITGMGWNALGYSQAFQPAVIQIARMGGVYAVSALLTASSSAVVFALIYLERPRGFLVLTGAGIVTLLVLLYGGIVIDRPQPSTSVPTAVIQPDVPIEGSWGDASFEEQMLQTHILLSERALKEADDVGDDRPEIIIWPESPMNFEYEQDESLRSKLAEFTIRNHVYLLMNSWAHSARGDRSDAVYNSAMVIGPSGERISRYDKIALMPFGEYVPARGWIPFMERIPALVADVTAGRGGPTVSRVGPANLGTTICFETTRPEIARKMRDQGASVLIQISNEAWFGPTSAARQMLYHAVFRAVENNVELIRATNSGISAEVSARGYVSGETPMFDTAIRRWRVGAAEEVESKTFYTRHGDVLAQASSALSLMLLLGGVITWKRKGKESRDDRGAES